MGRQLLQSLLFQGNSDLYFRKEKNKTKGGNDYVDFPVLGMNDTQSHTVDPNLSFTHDKEEAKWDYFREDPHLHVFHSLLHQETFNNNFSFFPIYD